MPEKTRYHNVKVAVRNLAELSHRRGGLAAPVYGGIDSQEGLEAHKKFLQGLKNNEKFYSLLTSEISVYGELVYQNFNFQVSGRLDCLSIQDNKLTLYEVKSFQNDPLFLPKDGDPRHWAQVILYAYLLKNESYSTLKKSFKRHPEELIKQVHLALENKEIELIIVYSAIDKDQQIFKKKRMTWEDINSFVLDTLEKYTKYIVYFIEWQKVRNTSIKESTFPFEKLRQGQSEMMRDVLFAIKNKTSLISQAPTGIGKTMASLYPSIKALSANYIDKIFYSTAMIATREVAENSLDILRNNGFLLKSIRYKSKEDICLQKDLFCDQSLCPYAIDYYDRLPKALHDLMPIQKVTPELIQDIARKYQVCPHELSIDYGDFCDVLIGDYNHIFDPQAKFKRFIDDDNRPIALLVDEAHNLPSRARNMYSSTISAEAMVRVRQIIKNPVFNWSNQYSSLLNVLEELINDFSSFAEIVKIGEKPKINPFFSPNHNKWLIEDNFIGVREKPNLLLKKLDSLYQEMRDFLDQQKLFEGRQEILDSWFEINYFLKVADVFFNEAYITAFKISPNGYLCGYLLALDASKFITKTYKNLHPIIFFSATLSPMSYYHKLLNADAENYPSELLSLASPFLAQNRLLAALTQYSVKFKDRQDSLGPISQFIAQACQYKVGNYLVFVPSYQYLFKIKQWFTRYFQKPGFRLSFQSRNMSQDQKDSFLSNFNQFGQDTLISFAVLGSHFNEGIDLVGEKLSGVFVLGTGLPQISPERELMAQYYAEKYEGGKAYGYQYPGFNKIQQAIGRLIRDENDIGFAILIDSRYASPEWQTIYPSDWQVRNFDKSENLLEDIEIFWHDQT